MQYGFSFIKIIVSKVSSVYFQKVLNFRAKNHHWILAIFGAKIQNQCPKLVFLEKAIFGNREPLIMVINGNLPIELLVI